MIAVFVGLVAIALALLYWYLTATFSYWRDKGVPFYPALPLVGSMAGRVLLREHVSQMLQRYYDTFDGEKFAGYFQGRTPALMIRDAELVKSIMIKDFAHFTDHGFTLSEEVDPLQAKNLFNMEGHRWKEMRAKLSPTFTSGRMKAMFPLVLEIAEHFEQHLAKLADSGQHIDIKDLLARYTTDVISSCAFGVRRDSITDPDDIFRVMGRRIFDLTSIEAVKVVIIFTAPKIAKFFKFKFSKPEVESFFTGLVRDVMAQRKSSGEARKDFMQLLMEIKEKGSVTTSLEDQQELESEQHAEGGTNKTHTTSKWTDLDVLAQAFVFFTAGFETSSSALTFALYELARRPELQRKAREHIEEVLARHGGHVTYQSLQDMTYLDWILSESLRKYPIVPMLNRICIKPYTLPGTSVTIDAGTHLSIPICAMQHDPSLFPEPERFHPERFSEENWDPAMQYVYMPFGEGPRQCIGLRFARMQSKLGLVSLLRQFEVRPSARTPYPLSFDPKQFLLVAKEDIFLKLIKAQK